MKFIFQLIFYTTLAGADSEIQKNNSKQNSTQKTTSAVNYRIDQTNEDKDQTAFFPRIEELFKNPAILSGLENGVTALNKSVENLMAGIFYSLLDNEIIVNIDENNSVSANLTRQVYSTSRGEYVIVDRIDLGPNFSKQINQIGGTPIFLKSNLKNNVLDIYVRHDAERLAHATEIPTFRYFINNWFGLLPILESILPPSFNPNEMYDPLRQLEAPFVLPLTAESFDAMPEGTIRSYGIEGGISLPFDFRGVLSEDKRKALFEQKVNFEFPLSVFVRGEYRINILKRSPKRAWIGLTRKKSVGHGLSSLLGNTFFLLKNALTPIPWKGVPSGFFPLDLSLESSLSSLFEHLFEFDLSTESGESSYLAAVRGDFSQAKNLSKSKSNVIFHYTKEQESKNFSKSITNNLFVFRKSRDFALSKSEIQITDSSGKFFILENTLDTKDKKWDLLTGDQSLDYSFASELNVKKEVDKSYSFVHNVEPFSVNLDFKIRDKSTDVEEFDFYNSELSNFSNLPMDDLPKFPLFLEDEKNAYLKSIYFENPNNTSLTFHAPLLSLGEFHAIARIQFSYSKIMKILFSDENVIKMTFMKIYKQQPSEGWLNSAIDNAHYALLTPLKLININNPKADYIHESSHFLKSIRNLKKSKTPQEFLEGFDLLFETNYPQKLSKCFMKLLEPSSIPTKIQLFTKPHKSLEPGIKVNFEKLNGKTWNSSSSFPEKERYQLAKEKTEAFHPKNLKDERSKLSMTNARIEVQEKFPSDEKKLLVILQIKNSSNRTPTYFYLRLAKAGKIQLGKFVLGQTIAQLLPDAPTHVIDENLFKFFLNGDESPLEYQLFPNAIEEGGDFSLQVSLSKDGVIWNRDVELFFSYTNGNVTLSPTR